MSIQILSEVVAAQIAAGEVVERPASVVKELIENSLDAGAHLIRVEVDGGGRRLIRITDDGSGIPSAEAELAFAPHATSKLHILADLDNIQTLGFRGEALASMASVAQITLLTRTADEATGTQLRLEGGRLLEHRHVGTPVGTLITVEKLFFNAPVRLKFLKAEATERRHIDAVVTRYAMAYPNVRFSLIQDGRVTFSTAGTGDLADVLVEVLGSEIMRGMLLVSPTEPLRPDLPGITVFGYTSAPHVNRNTRSHITLFVNGRHIQDTSLNYAVSQAYHTLMPDDRYPVSVLMIDMPPGDVDVNVHPAKSEVRFRSPDAVFSAVQRAVRRAVIAQAPIPTAAPQAFGEDAPWDDDHTDMSARVAPSNPLNTANAANAANTGYRRTGHAQLDFDLPAFDAGRRSHQTGYTRQLPERAADEEEPLPETAIDTRAVNSANPAADLMQRPRSLPPLRVVGQIAATYIVAEGPAGLYLVDQHAAHERILYEQFMLEQANRQIVAQQTLDGAAVELAPASARLIEDNLDTLKAIGFDIEAFGVNTFRVRAIPSLFANRIPQAAIGAILEDLESDLEPGASTLEAKITLRVCKAAAVKAGQILSYDEMQALLRQLERCTSPRTCPHGRPTMIHLTKDQLDKEFGRM